MPTPDEIIEYVRWWSETEASCAPDEDVLEAFGLVGDDADELIDAFSVRYEVELNGFFSYFHYDATEPPLQKPRWPLGPDGETLGRIPITPTMLADAANAGRWTLDYPPHVPPPRAIINTLPMTAFLVMLVLVLSLWQVVWEKCV